MSQLNLLSPENGAWKSFRFCLLWRFQGGKPLFSTLSFPRAQVAGQHGLPSGNPDASALIQMVCVNQLFPVVLARRAAIISLGQW